MFRISRPANSFLPLKDTSAYYLRRNKFSQRLHIKALSGLTKRTESFSATLFYTGTCPLLQSALPQVTCYLLGVQRALLDLIFRAVTNSSSLRFQGSLWLQTVLKMPSIARLRGQRPPEGTCITVSYCT